MTEGLGRYYNGHVIHFGKCTRCGRNGGKILESRNVQCDGHRWDSPDPKPPLYERYLFCTVCFATYKLMYGRTGESYKHRGSPCNGEKVDVSEAGEVK